MAFSKNGRLPSVETTLEALAGDAPATDYGILPRGKEPTHANAQPELGDLTEEEPYSIDSLRDGVKACSQLSEEDRKEILAILDRAGKTEVDDTIESLICGGPAVATRFTEETTDHLSLKELKKRVRQTIEANAIRDQLDDAGVRFADRAGRERAIRSLVPLSPEQRKAEIQERARTQRRVQRLRGE